MKALQKATGVHSEKGSDLRRISKNRSRRREIFPRFSKASTTRGKTPKTAATSKKKISAMMQIWSSPPSKFMLAPPRTNVLSAKYFDLGRFLRAGLEKIHCQAHCLFIPHHLHERLGAKRVKILNSMLLKPQKSLDCSQQTGGIEDRKKSQQNKRTCRASGLNLSQRRSKSRKTKGRGSPTGIQYSATNSRSRETSFEIGRLSLEQTSNLDYTRLYPSFFEVCNILLIFFDGKAEIALFSAKIPKLKPSRAQL